MFPQGGRDHVIDSIGWGILTGFLPKNSKNRVEILEKMFHGCTEAATVRGEDLKQECRKICACKNIYVCEHTV